MAKLHSFDLEERTAKFSEQIINFCKTLRLDYINESLIKQLIRSATSIGANYMEANGCDSKKDFKYKISICKKEAKETCYWLHMIALAIPEQKNQMRKYWQESHELVLIFSSITHKI